MRSQRSFTRWSMFAPSSPPATAPAPTPAAPAAAPRLTYSGLFDMYYQYQFNNPKNLFNSDLGTPNYDRRNNTPALSLAELNLAYAPPTDGGVGGKATLITGDTADINHGVFDSGDSSTNEGRFKNIQQLYVTYLWKQGYGVDFGKFYTPFGYEVTGIVHLAAAAIGLSSTWRARAATGRSVLRTTSRTSSTSTGISRSKGISVRSALCWAISSRSCVRWATAMRRDPAAVTSTRHRCPCQDTVCRPGSRPATAVAMPAGGSTPGAPKGRTRTSFSGSDPARCAGRRGMAIWPVAIMSAVSCRLPSRISFASCSAQTNDRTAARAPVRKMAATRPTISRH